MSLPYLGAYTGLQVDAALGAIRGENTLIAPLRLGAGTKTAPALSFGAELTSGLYRAAAGDIRLSVLDTDVACFGLVSGSAALGIGTAPLVNFHIKRDIAGNFTPWLAENANTTDNNAILLEYRSNTTGVGAASFQQFAWVTLQSLIHDHPTRSGTVSLNYANSGGFVFMQFVGDGILQRTNGNIEIKSNNGNGNVTLTPNGTGRVRLTLDGTTASPSLQFINEAGMGFYRKSSGLFSIAVGGSDCILTQRVTAAGMTNQPCLGIGVTPAVPLNIEYTDATASAVNIMRISNRSTTDGNGFALEYRSDTTGVGATALTQFCTFSMRALTHDHPTRSVSVSISWFTAAAAQAVIWSAAAYVPGANNTLDLGSTSLKWKNIYWATQALSIDGTAGAPGFSFASEATAGLYRAGAANIRFSVASQDITTWTRVSGSGVTNQSSLGIGVASPLRAFHILAPSASSYALCYFENTDTTNGNGFQLTFRGNTSGAGAASGVEFGSIELNMSTHDNATHASNFTFYIKSAGAYDSFSMVPGGIFQRTSGSLTLRSAAGNGDVILTANGTGRVNITGGSAKLGVNTIEASTGAAVTMDCTLVLPIAAARFIRFVAGANQRAGDAVLVAGTVTVACTTVSANTRIYLTPKTIGGTPGFLSYTLNAGVGFTINSSSASDTSTISFVLIEVS